MTKAVITWAFQGLGTVGLLLIQASISNFSLGLGICIAGIALFWFLSTIVSCLTEARP